MIPLEIGFWLCVAIVAYTYFAYPITLAFLSRWRARPRRIEALTTSLSFVLPVHNEAKNLERRLKELTGLLQASGMVGEIIVVSDASTDATADVANRYADRGVKLVKLQEKSGKSAGLSAGCAIAQHEILIFADARQHWADDALLRLIENFADPAVGAVSGDLVLESAPGVLAGVGLYWRFEKWLRITESSLYSQVGVTGAISACRRSLFRPVPAGTLLDDVYWPMHVVLQGYRVVHDERARAFDRLPENPRDEFRRKVRTLAGNFQLLTLLPASALLPWRNRVWVAWLSHKLMRLVVPWALLGLLFASALLPGLGYQSFFALQGLAYSLALLGLFPAFGQRLKLLSAAASFLVLNSAAWLAFWVWITGRTDRAWHRARYLPAPTP